MAHGDRSVDVFVGKLRQKLRNGSPAWVYIHTHFGVGYRFAPEREGEAVEPDSSAGERMPGPVADTVPSGGPSSAAGDPAAPSRDHQGDLPIPALD